MCRSRDWCGRWLSSLRGCVGRGLVECCWVEVEALLAGVLCRRGFICGRCGCWWWLRTSGRVAAGWHKVYSLARAWAGVGAERRRSQRCGVLLVDEGSIRGGRRFVRVIVNADTDGTSRWRCSVVGRRCRRRRPTGHRWCKGVRPSTPAWATPVACWTASTPQVVLSGAHRGAVASSAESAKGRARLRAGVSGPASRCCAAAAPHSCARRLQRSTALLPCRGAGSCRVWCSVESGATGANGAGCAPRVLGVAASLGAARPLAGAAGDDRAGSGSGPSWERPVPASPVRRGLPAGGCRAQIVNTAAIDLGDAPCRGFGPCSDARVISLEGFPAAPNPPAPPNRVWLQLAGSRPPMERRLVSCVGWFVVQGSGPCRRR